MKLKDESAVELLRAVTFGVLAVIVLTAFGCSGAQAPDTEGNAEPPTVEMEQPTTETVASPPTAPVRLQPPAVADSGGSTRGAKLGVGDVLEIDIFGLDELDRKERVQEDGTISMPLLGGFKVAGLTLPAAEALIARMLTERRLVNDPQVSIFVEEFSSRGVSVQGAVNTPGVYQMLGMRTLLDLIGEAGGFAADRGRNLFVLRRAGYRTQHRFEIAIDPLIEGRDLSLNIFLEAGDLVMVPQARTQRVYVTGAVASPGAIEFSSGEGITVLQAITAAGGPTERANLRKVTVTRRHDDGSQERWRVNVKAVQNGKEDDLALMGNDTVVVSEWLF